MRVIKCLWIDDIQEWAISAQTNLKIICPKFQIDFKIVNVTNGEDIIQQCMSYDFNIIIMDYHMEPFRGDKYIQDIRAEEHLESIPILFYSQDNNADLQELVGNAKKVKCVYRPNLVDTIIEDFFEKSSTF